MVGCCIRVLVGMFSCVFSCLFNVPSQFNTGAEGQMVLHRTLSNIVQRTVNRCEVLDVFHFCDFMFAKGFDTSVLGRPTMLRASSKGESGDEIQKQVEHLQAIKVGQHSTKGKEPKFYACVSIPCLCSVVIALGLAKARERQSWV